MKEMCLECSGSGQVECQHCGGSGLEAASALLHDTCRKCQGTRCEPCGHCGGTGQIEMVQDVAA